MRTKAFKGMWLVIFFLNVFVVYYAHYLIKNTVKHLCCERLALNIAATKKKYIYICTLKGGVDTHSLECPTLFA